MLIASRFPEIFLVTLFTAALICGIAEFRRAPRGRLLLYFVLRTGAVLALYLMLSNSGSLQWEKKRAPLPVLLLRDVSDSMKILPQTTQREFRMIHEETRRALHAVPNAQIAELVFAAGSAPADAQEKVPGGSTALGDTLASLAGQYPKGKILLLSDGRSNRGVHPAAAAAFLKNLGFTLHVLLPGRTGDGESPSLAFGTVTIPDTIQSRQPPEFHAALLVSGLPEGKNEAALHAELRIDGKTAGQLRKKADASVIELRFKPDEAHFPAAGWHELEIRASMLLPGREPLTAVYRDVFEVPAENAAMLLWNRMDPELNALLPLLRERYTPFHFFYAPRFAKQTAKEQEKRIASLRLLLLGPVLPDQLSGEVRKQIAGKLREKSLTLLFLSPRVLNAWNRDPEIGPFVPAADAAFTRLPDGTRYQFTESGTVRTLAFASLWRMVPKVSAAAKALPGDWNGIPPLLLSGGNVTVFAATDTWRWKIAPDRSRALAFIPFWTQMLDASDNFDASNLHFTITRADPLLSSDLYRFTVEDYAKQASGKALRLLRCAPGRKTMRTLLSFAPAENRVTSLQLRITEPGIHWFQVEDAKSHRKTPMIPLVIRGNEAETRFHTPDLELLRELAGLGGGQAVRQEEIRPLIAELARQAEQAAIRHKRKHREPPGGFRLACALSAMLLLSMEWLLRKKESSHAES